MTDAKHVENKYRKATLANLTEGSPLRAWVEDRIEDWGYEALISVHDFDEDTWRAYRRIVEEFGELWPSIGGVSGQTIVLRYIARMPKMRRNGAEYAQPYSYGLHLAALREAAHRAGVKTEDPSRPRAQAVPYSSQDAERVSFSDSSVRTS